jgi:predicted NAD-dependent protein-ADP-ribosyltransferase YbiA (DUF1768 family)
MEAQEYVYFKSNGKAPLHQLSNFFYAPFVLKRSDVTMDMRAVCPGIVEWVPCGEEGLRFPTSEHLWQSLKATEKATFLRFTSDGDLGRWNPDVFANSVAWKKDPAKRARLVAEKLATWKAKNNLGVQAKLAANADYAKRLGLDGGKMNFDREHLAPVIERAVWLVILRLKFRQNEGLLRVLLATRGKHLIERSISAIRLRREGKPLPHWEGMVDPDHAGLVIVGDNAMGNYLMAVRDSLV